MGLIGGGAGGKSIGKISNFAVSVQISAKWVHSIVHQLLTNFYPSLFLANFAVIKQRSNT